MPVILDEHGGFPEAEILTLAVRPALRRQGLGAALVSCAADHARQQGVDQLFLEVSVANAAAQSLYAGLGFAEVGLRKAYYSLGNAKFDDALILRTNLPLSPLGNRLGTG